MQSDPQATRPALDLRPLVGFGVLAALDLVVLGLAERSPVTAGTWSLVLGSALVHALLPGCVGALALPWLPRRRTPRGRVARVGVSVALFTIGALLVHDDVSNAAARAGLGAWAAWLAAGLAAQLILLSALAGALPRRPLTRALTGLACVVLHLQNHAFLARSYLGLHLIFFLSVGAALSATLPVIAVRRPWARLPVVALLLLALLPSTPHVLVTLLRHPGAAITPFLARGHVALRRAAKSERAPQRAPRSASRPGLSVERPIVVLVTIDALRSDVLTEHAEVAPRLGALSREAVVFENARSNGSSTVVSLSALFSGRLYSQLRWQEHPELPQLFPHEDPSHGFAHYLDEAGITTASVAGITYLEGRFGVTRGVRHHVRVDHDVANPKGEFAAAPPVVEAVLKTAILHRETPLFVYAHLMEPHSPYDMGGRSGTQFQRYLREVTLADDAVGQLVDGLRGAGLWERTVLIVTADHGEAFGEHATHFHGTTLYEELVRVPLVVRLPGVEPRRVDELVSLLDLGPTILDVFGLDTPGHHLGESLLPRARGATGDDRFIPLESGRRIQSLVFANGYKVIYDRRSGAGELFDLRVDPKEGTNLFETMGDTRPHLDHLVDWFDQQAWTDDGYDAPFRPL